MGDTAIGRTLKFERGRKSSSKEAWSWFKKVENAESMLCKIEGVEYRVEKNGVLIRTDTLDDLHRTAFLMGEYITRCLEREEEWKLTEWYSSLRASPLAADAGTGSEGKSLNATVNELSKNMEFKLPRAASTRPRARGPGISVPELRLPWETASLPCNVSVEGPKDQSPPSPVILEPAKSTGTQSSVTDCPF